MRAKLAKAVLGLQQGTGVTETLPAGSVVELSSPAGSDGVMIIEWKGRSFSLFREDLLDACSVDDAGRLGWF